MNKKNAMKTYLVQEFLFYIAFQLYYLPRLNLKMLWSPTVAISTYFHHI